MTEDAANPRNVRWRWFTGAVLGGATLQVILLAFALHASLIIASISSNCGSCYWALSGTYITLGFSLALLVVPWHRLGIRIAVSIGVFFLSFAWGFLYHSK
jgi:hypothetical protein